MFCGHSESTLAPSEKSTYSNPDPEKPPHAREYTQLQAVGQKDEGGSKKAEPASRDFLCRSSSLRGSTDGCRSPLQRSPPSRNSHDYIPFNTEKAAPRGQKENVRDEEKEYEVGWDGDQDPMNPKNMSTGRKWVIVLVLSSGSACVTCTSSMYTSAYDQISNEWHVSRVVATLGLSLFVMGLGLSPMVLAPLSEFYGRRPIYVCSFTFFLIWLIPCAVAKNLATELVARFFDGMAGSAFLSVAGGTVGDMFNRNELHAPMMIFTASPFIGPPVGPMIAGFINEYTTWYVSRNTVTYKCILTI